MIKVSFLAGEDARGPNVIPLFGSAGSVFEKTAAPSLLPEVVQYVESLRPRKDAQYVLVNAMGALEWWGSNINGDGFSEASLLHRPSDWTGNPLLDRIKAKTWPYGFPTFYNARPYMHHRNRDATKALGDVELATWNPRMKRVELVLRLDEDKCQEFGGAGVWDKLQAGEYPPLSMGTRVPFDTCSVCLDWDTYRKAQASYVPGRDASPGAAVLRYHKALQKKDGQGIRGLSITRADYCVHAKTMMNRILPDGRKVFVYNDYPNFFDISFVFVGADRTAKTMLKIASDGASVRRAQGAERLGQAEAGAVKTASAALDILKQAFGKQAKDKDAEIVKDVMPSQFADSAVSALTQQEPDLPDDVLDALGCSPLSSALSTPCGCGMVLRPREFQRILLIQTGQRPLADRLDEEGAVFPRVEDAAPVPMGADRFSPILARLLLPFLAARSALGPALENRALVSARPVTEKRASASSHSSSVLRKIGAAYNTYRLNVMDLVAHAPSFVASVALPSEGRLHKLAGTSIDGLFTPLSASYLKLAFWDEVATASVEKGLPSRNTLAQR